MKFSKRKKQRKTFILIMTDINYKSPLWSFYKSTEIENISQSQKVEQKECIYSPNDIH